MILDYSDYRASESYDSDVIVVGTGAGGATVGYELAKEGLISIMQKKTLQNL